MKIIFDFLFIIYFGFYELFFDACKCKNEMEHIKFYSLIFFKIFSFFDEN